MKKKSIKPRINEKLVKAMLLVKEYYETKFSDKPKIQESNDNGWSPMQVTKILIALAFGAYFVFWSLRVLELLAS